MNTQKHSFERWFYMLFHDFEIINLRKRYKTTMSHVKPPCAREKHTIFPCKTHLKPTPAFVGLAVAPGVNVPVFWGAAPGGQWTFRSRPLGDSIYL